MATAQRSYASNVPGTFFVDDTCIDCDLCRQIASGMFTEESDHSVVSRQPQSSEETLQAAMALLSCPTGSIGTHTKVDMRPAIEALPEKVDDNVYFCGYASANSYGASSYLVVRPNGNILIDSPRFTSSLVRRIEELGGVATMFFTHRDDVADHEKFRRHFGCRRIIHEADASAANAEEILRGQEFVQLDPDLLVVPVPGHTRGHAVLNYRNKFLFTGDHLAWSDRRHGLIAFRDACWYSWKEQTRSMEKLIGLAFEWVLPGHGRRAHLSAETMQEKLKSCIEWMKTA